MSENLNGALSGIRILDLTHVLSGPYCTQIFGDLGAEVIKIESPAKDHARNIPPYFVGGDSVYYLAVNRNKRSLVIDLKQQEGRDLLRRLALASDVVIENFRPGVMDRLGLSATALRQQKPALIWCSITGFGQDGPYRDKAAFDMIVQALSGGMSLTGESGGPAVRAGIPVGDLAAGMYAAIAILAALQRRHSSGRGDVVDISMLDCQAAMLGYQAAYFMQSGIVPGRQGRAHDSIASYGAFATADAREIVVAAWTEKMWADLCRVLGRSDLLSDERFSDNGARRKHREALWAVLEAEIARHELRRLLEMFDRAGIPAAPVNAVDQAVADPQLHARGMVLDLAAADGRHVKVMGNPIRFSESVAPEHRYPPAPGEDNSEILQKVLGFSDVEIAALRQRRVVLDALLGEAAT